MLSVGVGPQVLGAGSCGCMYVGMSGNMVLIWLTWVGW